MSVSYTSVGWTVHKKRYDGAIVAGIAAYLGLYYAIGRLSGIAPADATDETLLIRGLGTCGLLMLHIVLWIGPLVRLNRNLLPLLFNRRHLGVATFLVGLAHAALSLGQFHALGNENPLASLLTANRHVGSLARFPFELLGLGALLVLFLMAATSHDFWLKNLSARTWKALHMFVYGAYAMLVMHVVLGALQDERHPVLLVLLCGGAAVTVGLHATVGVREWRKDAGTGDEHGWVDAGDAATIPENRARTVCTPGGERIAVFRYGGKVSAVENVCRHQGGPLGEGKIIDGCITCPWHGWQYRPGDGCSPPPFHEKIRTHQVRIVGGRVHVRTDALSEGTPVEPATLSTPDAGRAGAGHG